MDKNKTKQKNNSPPGGNGQRISLLLFNFTTI